MKKIITLLIIVVAFLSGCAAVLDEGKETIRDGGRDTLLSISDDLDDYDFEGDLNIIEAFALQYTGDYIEVSEAQFWKAYEDLREFSYTALMLSREVEKNLD